MELIAVCMGGQIGYTTGDPLNLLEDLAILKPHFVPLVPRVLNRVYQSAMAAGTAPGIKGALFRKAVATKLANLKTNGQFYHAFWDKLVFRKVSSSAGAIAALCSLECIAAAKRAWRKDEAPDDGLCAY